jgi:hypothetical protein
MTIPAAADTHGSTLTFSGLTMHQISIDPPTMKRKAIDSSHLGSTSVMESIPAKLYDAGQITLHGEFDPATVPPMLAAESALAILFATTVPATWTWARAILTDFQIGSLKSGDKATCSATFKLSSVPVVS